MANRNTLQAEIIVDELARSGLEAVCAAPGSRHTPLMIAFARHPKITVYSHLDERSAAFFALGLAMSRGVPVALICTSGTAGANMLPAIIEAQQSHIPLIVMTADRPHELRHSGANQTIDQVKLFGDAVKWFVDVALPEATPPDVVQRNWRTLANRAFATAAQTPRGAVHLNLPYRKPLEPVRVPDDMQQPSPDALPRRDNAPYTRIYPPQLSVNAQSVRDISAIVNEYPNGWIVCGPQTGYEHAAAIRQLSDVSGYPVLVDVLSGLRYGVADVYGSYDTALMQPRDDITAPDVVLRFGRVPTSKWLNQQLDRLPAGGIVHISDDGTWADDTHRLSHRVQAPVSDFCRALADNITRPAGELRAEWDAVESNIWATFAAKFDELPFFDGTAVYDVLNALPDNGLLFAGNSLPVRHVDQFARPHDMQFIDVYANRGASGIDGNISTALGIGAGELDRALVALVGDITFYHDMNGLLAVQRCGVPVTIVLLNNDGGGIFQRLPVNQFEPEFTDYFVTAHGLDFSHAAALYGLRYVRADDRDTLQNALHDAVGSASSTLIEVRTDAKNDLALRQRLVKGFATF